MPKIPSLNEIEEAFNKLKDATEGVIKEEHVEKASAQVQDAAHEVIKSVRRDPLNALNEAYAFLRFSPGEYSIWRELRRRNRRQ